MPFDPRSLVGQPTIVATSLLAAHGLRAFVASEDGRLRRPLFDPHAVQLAVARGRVVDVWHGATASTGAIDPYAIGNLPPEGDVTRMLESGSYGAYSDSAIADITKAYSQIRNSPTGVLASAVMKSVKGGSTPQAMFDAVSPVIATGLTALVASGGAAAPVVGLVALGYALAAGVIDNLLGGIGTKDCNWLVGNACMQIPATERPYSPSDGKWTRIRDYYQANKNVFGSNLAEVALPGISQVLCELDGLVGYVVAGGNPRFADFLRAYYNVWLANAEQAINGHPFVSYQAPNKYGMSQWVDPALMLSNVITGWNQNFADSEVHRFSLAAQPSIIGRCDPPGTYLDQVISGIHGRSRLDPNLYVVNIGQQVPVHVDIPHLPPPGPHTLPRDHNIDPNLPDGKKSSAVPIIAAGAAIGLFAFLRR